MRTMQRGQAQPLRLGLSGWKWPVFIRLKPGKDHGFQAFYDLADTIAGRGLHGDPDEPGSCGPGEIQAVEDPRRKAIGNEAFGENCP